MSIASAVSVSTATSKLRLFSAYLQTVKNVESLSEVTSAMPHKSGRQPPVNDPSTLYPLIGFSIKCAINQIPTATASLPVGDYLTNLMASATEAGDPSDPNYVFRPVQGAGSYRSQATNQLADPRGGYIGAIIWYREELEDSDLMYGREGWWKPLFKGVVSLTSLTRIAYSQESADIRLNHWGYLLDNVLVQNAVIDVVSSDSARNPALHPNLKLHTNVNTGSVVEADTLKPTITASGAVDAALQGSADSLPVFPAAIRWMHHEARLSASWPQDWRAVDQRILDSYLSNLRFVRSTLENMEKRYGLLTSQATQPRFTKANVKTNSTPEVTFRLLAQQECQGRYNGLTYRQALENIAANAGLSMIYTTNSITMEALAYRPKTWKFSAYDRGPVKHAIQVIASKTFARELVGAVGTYGMSPPTDPQNPSSIGRVNYGHIYYDPEVLSYNYAGSSAPVLGSLAILPLPPWFKLPGGNNDPGKYIRKAGKNSLVIGEGMSFQLQTNFTATTDEQAKVLEAEQEKVNNIMSLFYYQLKARNRSVRVTLPFDINTCVGMPVCVEDAANQLYYSGVVMSFEHTLSRGNNTAHTSWLIGNAEVFRSATTPTENPSANASDKDPFYDVPVFTGRAIYA